ncbi:MAG TPA: anthrone oxygenase family protein [Leptolyngbyaceae cyanobacterium]
MLQNYFVLKLFSAIGCGLVAGVFFAFSTFVMNALSRLQPKEGIAAMQSINITAINPLFMIALFGTAATCLFLTVFSLLKWQQPGAVYSLVGSLLYLIGTILVTIAFNVPLNDALAHVKPESIEGAKLWAKYLTDWTFWNHVRTLAALVAAVLLTLVANLY